MKFTVLTDFNQSSIIRHACAVEAGYVNNPADKGGETNHGITAATAAEFKAVLVAKYGWDGTMRNLTEEMAIYIYQVGWWDRLHCNELLAVHPFIADRIFDFGVNAGRGAAATNLQRILNVMNRMQQDYRDLKVDGVMGPGTVAALKSYVTKRGTTGVLNLIQLLIDLQGAHYVQVSEKRELNETFMTGWTTRVREANQTYQAILQG